MSHPKVATDWTPISSGRHKRSKSKVARSQSKARPAVRPHKKVLTNVRLKFQEAYEMSVRGRLNNMLVRDGVSGLDDANPVVREFVVQVGHFNFGHVAGHALTAALGAAARLSRLGLRLFRA